MAFSFPRLYYLSWMCSHLHRQYSWAHTRYTCAVVEICSTIIWNLAYFCSYAARNRKGNDEKHSQRILSELLWSIRSIYIAFLCVWIFFLNEFYCICVNVVHIFRSAKRWRKPINPTPVNGLSEIKFYYNSLTKILTVIIFVLFDQNNKFQPWIFNLNVLVFLFCFLFQFINKWCYC